MVRYENRYQWAIAAIVGIALCVAMIVLAAFEALGLDTAGIRLICGALIVLLATVVFAILK